MKNISELFHCAALLEQDEAETQYQVSFDRGTFWLDLPAGKDPAQPELIFVFNGAGVPGKKNNLMHPGPASEFRRDMLAAGFGFVCADCSPIAFGSPESTEASLRASEYCRSRGMNVPDRISLLGFSMGGLGALMFAARHPEKTGRVADIFGITDLEDFCRNSNCNFKGILGEVSPADRAERSPLQYAARYKDIPILIMHGDQDQVVDIAHSERLYALLKQQGSPVEFQVIPGYGHTNDILAGAGCFVKTFMKKIL